MVEIRADVREQPLIYGQFLGVEVNDLDDKGWAIQGGTKDHTL